MRMERYKAFSLVSSAYCFSFLVMLNFFYSSYPWVIYCIPAFIIWPWAVCRPRSMGNKVFAFLLSGMVTAYYAIINLMAAPEYPWAMFIAFAVLWYPFSLVLGKKPFALSIFGLVWSILFFSILNAVSSPGEIWAVYPIFAVIWWPLSIFFFVEQKKNNKPIKNVSSE